VNEGREKRGGEKGLHGVVFLAPVLSPAGHGRKERKKKRLTEMKNLPFLIHESLSQQKKRRGKGEEEEDS